MLNVANNLYEIYKSPSIVDINYVNRNQNREQQGHQIGDSSIGMDNRGLSGTQSQTINHLKSEEHKKSNSDRRSVKSKYFKKRNTYH